MSWSFQVSVDSPTRQRARLPGHTRVDPAGNRAWVSRWVALGGLTAGVLASIWIALGASDGGYLLELPSHGRPRWIEGPLHGLSGLVGSFGPQALSTSLLVLCGAYVLALLCARSVSLRTALIAIALANMAFTLGPTIVSTDVFGYIAYGRELAHGLDPYVTPPIALGHDGLLRVVYWKHQPSPYGPLFTFLSVPLGLLSPSAALWILKAATGLASVGIASLVAAVAGRRGLDPARAAIFVGLNPVLLFYAVSGAHNDVLAVFLVMCALALTVRGMEATGAAAAVAGAAIKLTMGLALPFVVLLAARRSRAMCGALLAIVVLGVPSLLLFGTHLTDQLHHISTDSLFDTVFSGPDRLAGLLGVHITTTLRLLTTALAGALAVLAFAWAARGGDPIVAAGWAFLGLMASIASLAPWYLVWLLPLAALGGSRGLRGVCLLVTAYLILTHVPTLGGHPWLSQPHASGRAVTLASGLKTWIHPGWA